MSRFGNVSESGDSEERERLDVGAENNLDQNMYSFAFVLKFGDKE